MSPADLSAAGPPSAAVPNPCDLPGVELSAPCQLGDAAGDAVVSLAGGAVRELAEAVAAAAHDLASGVLEFLAAPVRPDLSSAWLSAGADRMTAASSLFAGVFFLAALLSATARGSMSGLGRVVGYTVAAFAGSGVAIALVQGLVALTDVATAQVAASAPRDMVTTFSDLLAPLTILASAGGGGPVIAVLLGFGVALAAAAVWVELFLRAVMIHVVVYFVPLLLTGLIFGPTRRWARRGFEFLAVLILSKFVLYAVIALGWSATASFSDTGLKAAWGSVLTGLVLLIVAAFLPMLLFRMLPFMEAQVAAGMTRRDAATAARAPMAPVSAGMRVITQNLGRAATVGALAVGGPAAAGATAAGTSTAGASGAGAAGGAGGSPAALGAGRAAAGSGAASSAAAGSSPGGLTRQSAAAALPSSAGHRSNGSGERSRGGSSHPRGAAPEGPYREPDPAPRPAPSPAPRAAAAPPPPHRDVVVVGAGPRATAASTTSLAPAPLRAAAPPPAAAPHRTPPGGERR